MRRRLRNLLIRAGGIAVTLGGAAPAKRALAFHEVPDARALAEFLDRVREDFDVLGLDDWLSAPLGERGQLTLTFDDGYASWPGPVAEVLGERGLPAVFFVCSGLVGLEGERARAFTRRMLRTSELDFIDLEGLRELAAHERFEIGAHTRGHPDLGLVDDPQTARDEIAGGKEDLEGWLGTPVRWFAYPFGTPSNVTPLARSAAEESGLEAAFTLIPGPWRPEEGDRFLIGRDGLDPALPEAVSRAWLRGAYDRMYAIKSRVG